MAHNVPTAALLEALEIVSCTLVPLLAAIDGQELKKHLRSAFWESCCQKSANTMAQPLPLHCTYVSTALEQLSAAKAATAAKEQWLALEVRLVEKLDACAEQTCDDEDFASRWACKLVTRLDQHQAMLQAAGNVAQLSLDAVVLARRLVWNVELGVQAPEAVRLLHLHGRQLLQELLQKAEETDLTSFFRMAALLQLTPADNQEAMLAQARLRTPHYNRNSEPFYRSHDDYCAYDSHTDV